MAEKSVSSDSLAMETKQEYKGQKLRVGIIGCGGIAQTHLTALTEFPDVEVVAGCDILPERLQVMETKWGVKNTFTDWKKMLADMKGKVDAISVCTPNGLHAPVAIDCSNAGLDVIVEKPMAMTPDESQRMIDAAEKAKKKLVIGFQYRYHPATQFIKAARDAGQFGDIMFVKCQALRRRGIPNWGVFGRKELQGGGPMIDIGVHVIEMAHYVMGSPKPVAASGNYWTFMGNKPSEVSSQWPGWDHKTYTVEDLAIGHIRFENGAIMQIEASFVNHIPKDEWNFNLMGTKGGANWDPPSIFRDQAGHMTNSQPGYMPKSDFNVLFTAKLRNFVDHVLKGTPSEAPGSAGLAVQKILDGVYRAGDAKKEVEIK